jgi:hypothetical protein
MTLLERSSRVILFLGDANDCECPAHGNLYRRFTRGSKEAIIWVLQRRANMKDNHYELDQTIDEVQDLLISVLKELPLDEQQHYVENVAENLLNAFHRKQNEYVRLHYDIVEVEEPVSF